MVGVADGCVAATLSVVTGFSTVGSVGTVSSLSTVGGVSSGRSDDCSTAANTVGVGFAGSVSESRTIASSHGEDSGWLVSVILSNCAVE